MWQEEEEIMEHIISIASIFWDTTDQLLYVLILFVILDYITGICVAILNHKVSSEIGAKGISKKVGIFALISLCHIADRYLLNTPSVLQTVTTTFYIANEGISVIENIGRLGIPCSEKVKELLALFKKLKKD